MSDPRHNPVHVIGAGLAGSEAAWHLAEAGIPVILHEMRPERRTEAHQTENCAELVCSNSLRSDDAENNAVGLLHEELRRAGSLILKSADAHRLPAGGALAVDRDGFSGAVTQALATHPLVELRRGEVAGLPPAEWNNVIVATGPLTSPALSEAIRGLTGESALSFFDAIAPIVYRESIDMDKATTRAARKAMAAAITSTARWKSPPILLSSTPCSPAKRASSRSGKPTRPISKVACRSK
jgi:methylenetetrahydrofolate--tRNA-(uracil-5-)-methyltransferase